MLMLSHDDGLTNPSMKASMNTQNIVCSSMPHSQPAPEDRACLKPTTDILALASIKKWLDVLAEHHV